MRPGLKTIDDATAHPPPHPDRLREGGEAAADAMRQRLLTFVVIGGGPTGVEMAGAIAELREDGAARGFPQHRSRARPASSWSRRAPRLLAAFPAALSRPCQARSGEARRRGAPRPPGDRLRRARGVVIDGLEGIESRMRASGRPAWPPRRPPNGWAPRRTAPAGSRSIRISPCRTIPRSSSSATPPRSRAQTASRCPGIAPVAKQQGAYRRRRAAPPDPAGEAPPAPRFRYRNFGTLATIGRASAVADFGWIRLNGYLAWLLWGMIHVFFLIGFRNRLAVLAEWLWAYVSFRRGARLITGSDS